MAIGDVEPNVQTECAPEVDRPVHHQWHLNIQHLFDHCHDEIKLFKIQTNEYPIPSPPTHISLRSLSALHCLSLFIPVIDWDNVSPKPFPWLDHLLPKSTPPQRQATPPSTPSNSSWASIAYPSSNASTKLNGPTSTTTSRVFSNPVPLPPSPLRTHSHIPRQ
ncbi:hypothetical protein P691DRAFT_765665 [Macrolepiota fuliginosa MF-IS2]|uniref:Uncharacterized protein n=1 Tax=Macrolepiota fuliginosa MF-IS2 TaxID=1400762 RepID=A0A9P6BVN9_9AGAR|nr:hypothetical protein P691DRAFT_765665 [Macrolepiota fuliginosa MF-IS2]